MRHEVVPFPFGAREGELVVRVTDVAGQDPADVAGELLTVYRGTHQRELWFDAADVAGAGAPYKLGLALRRDHWKEVTVTGSVEAPSWPFFPARIVVDVSEYLSRPVEDRDVWVESIAGKIGKNPPAAEIYAIAPATEMIHPDLLYTLDTLTGAEDGCTLYVAEADLDRAILASRTAARPWVVRRLGALPPAISERARAASPAA